MADDDKYWFPAKRYGWGWGVPRRWQGWVALLLFVGLVLATAFLLDAERRPVEFFVVAAVLTGLFLLVCWYKGEPPRWRWGGD